MDLPAQTTGVGEWTCLQLYSWETRAGYLTQLARERIELSKKSRFHVIFWGSFNASIAREYDTGL